MTHVPLSPEIHIFNEEKKNPNQFFKFFLIFFFTIMITSWLSGNLSLSWLPKILDFWCLHKSDYLRNKKTITWHVMMSQKCFL